MYISILSSFMNDQEKNIEEFYGIKNYKILCTLLFELSLIKIKLEQSKHFNIILFYIFYNILNQKSITRIFKVLFSKQLGLLL